MSDFQKGLVFTVIPFLALAIITWLLRARGGVGISWLVFGLAFLAAFVAGMVFAVRGRRRTAAGIFVGIAIGVVAAGVSCFALVFTNI